MFKNKYDVVETNKMAMEDVSSLIDVERRAAEELENGRLVIREEETYKYAKGGDEELFLVTTPEVTYDGGGLDEFVNHEGRLVRAVKVVLHDIYSTTAYEGELEVGGKLVVGADGKLVAGEEGEVLFEVKGKRKLGKALGVTVERIK